MWGGGRVEFKSCGGSKAPAPESASGSVLIEKVSDFALERIADALERFESHVLFSLFDVVERGMVDTELARKLTLRPLPPEATNFNS